MSEDIAAESHQILEQWLVSCTRNKKISRNTIAMGIVVLNHLRQKSLVSRDEVISQGGEVGGARSGLGKILELYGIPSSYLKEITTRQAHQDGQHLFESFQWGQKFATADDEMRETILLELASRLSVEASAWFARQNLELQIDRRHSPAVWIGGILDSAKGKSAGIVEQHLVGAKLARRFSDVEIPNHPAHAADVQTKRLGDFNLEKIVYHVTANPSRDVIRKCAENLKGESHPILLIPRSQDSRARFLAQEEGIEQGLTIMAIEDFVAINIIEISTHEKKDFYSLLQEIIDIYNKRLLAVETDLSLQIEMK